MKNSLHEHPAESTCDYPIAQFVWGSIKCGDRATDQIRDSEDELGWVCDFHFRCISEARAREEVTDHGILEPKEELHSD